MRKTKPKSNPAKPIREVDLHYRIFERTDEGRLIHVVVGYDGDTAFQWERFDSIESAQDAIAQEDRISGRDLVILPVVSVTTRLVYE